MSLVPKNQLLMQMIQKEFPGYHPLLSIARIAHDVGADLKLQFECHRTIAKYVEPELKSMEIKGGLENISRVTVSLFDPTQPIEGEYVEIEQQSSEMVTIAVAEAEKAVSNW